jgi:sugar/nucleoside kinase (ribokinase family)
VKSSNPVLVLGSIAIDTIYTPTEEHAGILGGSASHAAVAASIFAPVRLTGIIGSDFPEKEVEWFRQCGMDLAGLEKAEGRTFSWTGKYQANMNLRETLAVDLGVFGDYRPTLPAAYRSTPIVLLGNIAPALQHHLLDQMERPHFVIADTMDLWIETAREELERLLTRVDMLILNDSEACLLTGESNLVRAGQALRKQGLRYVAVKKGEHGCLLFGQEGLFAAPAFPLETVRDPTGAGDCFAGGLAGSLAARGGPVDFEALRAGVVNGSVVASFNVEEFNLGRLRTLRREEVDSRVAALREIARFAI